MKSQRGFLHPHPRFLIPMTVGSFTAFNVEEEFITQSQPTKDGLNNISK